MKTTTFWIVLTFFFIAMSIAGSIPSMRIGQLDMMDDPESWLPIIICSITISMYIATCVSSYKLGASDPEEEMF
jgi:amino acid permease